MRKCVCDHCGKDLNAKTDFDDIEVETLDHVFFVDLCAECYNELEHALTSIIRDFTKKEAAE